MRDHHTNWPIEHMEYERLWLFFFPGCRFFIFIRWILTAPDSRYYCRWPCHWHRQGEGERARVANETWSNILLLGYVCIFLTLLRSRVVLSVVFIQAISHNFPCKDFHQNMPIWWNSDKSEPFFFWYRGAKINRILVMEVHAFLLAYCRRRRRRRRQRRCRQRLRPPLSFFYATMQSACFKLALGNQWQLNGNQTKAKV